MTDMLEPGAADTSAFAEDTANRRAGAPDVIYLPDQSARPQKKARSGSAKRKRQMGVFVRLLPEQIARLGADAAAARQSVPAYLVAGRLGDDAAPLPVRRPRRLPTIELQVLARNNAELNKIGSNLNQAVHALNEIALTGSGGMARVAHLTQPIQRVLDELRITLAANRQALGHDREG